MSDLPIISLYKDDEWHVNFEYIGGPYTLEEAEKNRKDISQCIARIKRHNMHSHLGLVSRKKCSLELTDEQISVLVGGG